MADEASRESTREHARACESVSFSVPLARYFSRHLPDGVLARGLHGFFRWLKEIFTGWKLTFFRANLRSQVTFNGTMGCSHSQRFQNDIRGRSRWRVQGVRTPPEMTCGFLIQLVFCKKKIGVYWCWSQEQETSAPPPKRNPGSAPGHLTK